VPVARDTAGRVVAAHGRHYLVRLADGRLLHCFPRGKKSTLACGDRVVLEDAAGERALIREIVPRSSLLYRSDLFKEKLIAANVSQVLLIVAVEPAFSPELLSRCLAAAADQELAVAIVLNKIDLEAGLAAARARLAPFRRAGFPVIELCALRDATPLAGRLRAHTSILVGQSGMGKSALINALVPDAGAATQAISQALDTGRHTTTFARLYAIDEDGALIDSPGLQVFGLAHVAPERIALGFPELAPLLGRCRFRDCRHDAEPDCALRTAAERGEIDSGRLQHYRLLWAEARAAARAY
jgi:ribosome biogenesis GTPase